MGSKLVLTGPAIDRFDGEFGFLSNFHLCNLVYLSVEYASSEHAYQAAKCVLQKDADAIRAAKTPGQAKRMGYRLKHIRDDWETQKVEIMRDILYRKFDQNDDLHAKLLATGDRLLVEGNTWGDTFWGQVNGKGKNMLGILLMGLRNEYRQQEESNVDD